MISIILTLLFGGVSHTQEGLASWYSEKDNHGHATSSGVPLNDSKLTAASRTIKNGTRIKVTNLSNGKVAILLISDHGPNLRGRILDCSVAAAKALGFYEKGLQKVLIEIL
jgi:rare lipoprotein A